MINEIINKLTSRLEANERVIDSLWLPDGKHVKEGGSAVVSRLSKENFRLSNLIDSLKTTPHIILDKGDYSSKRVGLTYSFFCTKKRGLSPPLFISVYQ